MLGHFSHYDYRQPEAVDSCYEGAFNIVVADPPYLVSSLLAFLVAMLVYALYAIHRERGSGPHLIRLTHFIDGQSDECLAKTTVTMKLLASTTAQPEHYLLTGASMHATAWMCLGLRWAPPINLPHCMLC